MVQSTKAIYECVKKAQKCFGLDWNFKNTIDRVPMDPAVLYTAIYSLQLPTPPICLHRVEARTRGL